MKLDRTAANLAVLDVVGRSCAPVHERLEAFAAVGTLDGPEAAAAGTVAAAAGGGFEHRLEAVARIDGRGIRCSRFGARARALFGVAHAWPVYGARVRATVPSALPWSNGCSRARAVDQRPDEDLCLGVAGPADGGPADCARRDLCAARAEWRRQDDADQY